MGNHGMRKNERKKEKIQKGRKIRRQKCPAMERTQQRGVICMDHELRDKVR